MDERRRNIRRVLDRLRESYRANPERLSVPNLNRALITILEAQQSILDRLAALETVSSEEAEIPAEPEEQQEVEPESAGAPEEESEPEPEPEPESAEPSAEEESESAPESEEEPAEAAPTASVLAVDFLARFTPIPSGPDLRKILRAFRIDELNRWLDSGTIFQMRENFAFVSLEQAGEKSYEDVIDNLERMGYDVQIGLLNTNVRSPVLVLKRGF